MLNVKLHHLSFTTDNLGNMVSFYRDQMGMIDVTESGDSVILKAKDRILHLTDGPKNRLNYAAYGAPNHAALLDLRKIHEAAGLAISASPSLIFGEEAYALVDPDGNKMVFGSHGYNHLRWQYLTKIEQENEIRRSIEFYKKIGIAINQLSICYPYGSYNKDSLNLFNQESSFGYLISSPITIINL